MSGRKSSRWTRAQLVQVILRYREIPFGQLHSRDPRVIALAEELGRTPGAVALKLVNFAHLDPDLARQGMSGCSRLDREVWEDCCQKWQAGAWEQVLHDYSPPYGPTDATGELTGGDMPAGEDAAVIARRRRGQEYFRNMVRAVYEERCCLTELPILELLNASHIIPWKDRKDTRLNPSNGLCLNALHDRAFDRGLITLNEDYRLVVSPQVGAGLSADVGAGRAGSRAVADLIVRYEGKPIRRPASHPPEQDFLQYHREHIFQR